MTNIIEVKRFQDYSANRVLFEVTIPIIISGRDVMVNKQIEQFTDLIKSKLIASVEEAINVDTIKRFAL